MKKNYLMMAAFATALAFTACSNEDEMPVVNGGNGTTVLDPESVIEIAISNTGTGTTRTARPVGSSEAYNNVNRVQLVFINENGTIVEAGASQGQIEFAGGTSGMYSVSNTGLITFEDGANKGPVANPDPVTDRDNQTAKIQVKGLTKGSYTIVAYGWNAESGNDFCYSSFSGSLETSSKYFSTGEINSANDFDIEEVFAGSTTATTVDQTTETAEEVKTVVKFTAPVEVKLTRQVAGMLAYFSEIPTQAGGQDVKTVKVKAIAETKSFYFPASLYDTANKGDFNGGNATNTGETLLTFTIPDEAKTTQNEQGASIYDFSDVENGYVPADGMTKVPDGFKVRPNTLFGGRFIIPFDKHYNSGQPATLVVELCNESGDVLSSFNVRTDDEPEEVESDDMGLLYDIRCNNFYSIGKKTEAGNNDDEEKDKPQSLTSNNELTVLICDQWAVLHDMTLE